MFRLISLAALVGAALLVAGITWTRTSSLQMACVGGLLASCSPGVYQWAGKAHPDVLQMAVVSAAILVVARKHSVRNTLIAAFFTGVAFGTKYAGFFLLPFLLVPVGLKRWGGAGRFEHNWVKGWLKLAASCAGVFLVGWVLTNPYAVSHFEAFTTDLLAEARHVARGHGREESANPLLWLVVLAREFSPAGLLLIGLGAVVCAASAVSAVRQNKARAFRDPSLRTDLFLLLYVVCGVSYVFLSVKMRRPRFLFHLYPALVVVGLTGLHLWAGRFGRLKRWLPVVLWVGAVALGMSTVGRTLGRTPASGHPYVQAGEFIGKRYDPATRVLADAYSYVPVEFASARFVWGIDYGAIAAFDPDILILNQGLSGRWSWKRDGTAFSDMTLAQGDFDGAAHYVEFQKALFRDPAWEIIYERPKIVVLEKTKPAGR